MKGESNNNNSNNNNNNNNNSENNNSEDNGEIVNSVTCNNKSSNLSEEHKCTTYTTEDGEAKHINNLNKSEKYVELKNKVNNDLASTNSSENEKETKDDANEKYKNGDYKGAVDTWERGLKSINYILSKKNELTSERLKIFQKMHSTYCSNIAQGYMKLNEYSECVKYSLLAQKNDKTNVKIYFRLGKGYFMLGEYDKAIEVLKEGIKIDKNSSLINLIELVQKKKKLHLEKEKYMMKYIFQRLKEKPLINDEKKIKPFFYTLYSFISFIFMWIYTFFVTSYDQLLLFINKCKMHKKGE
ncbi:tetratricopeptide repeat family protein, putative [Hepatocystis sp. ex Piliocolobus tephrosceles]|nr:tetratricopeptide repeat family protein, putative [Hepatocystis sp. ex Piliocolobus tephrosceles]